MAITLFDPSPVAGQSNGLGAGPDVRVVNSSAEPVPLKGLVTVESLPAVELDTTTPPGVFDVDNPAFQPFQVTFSVSSTPFPAVFVPEGKRLVIEHVTSSSFSEGDVFWIAVLTTAGGQFGSHHFPMSKLGARNGKNVYGMATQTRIYADPGSSMFIPVEANGPVLGTDRFVSISGYLVDVP